MIKRVARLYSTSIKSYILHTFHCLFFALSLPHFIISFHQCHFCIVNFVNIVFIDGEKKETNYARNRRTVRLNERKRGTVRDRVRSKERERESEASYTQCIQAGPLMITIFKLRIECANALQQCYAVNSDKIKHHLCLHIISARARRWNKNQEKE